MNGTKNMLLDSNLMYHFKDKIYYPLLDYLPKDWLEDFQHIVLRFEKSNNVTEAHLKDHTFSINVNLERMASMTWEQFGKNEENLQVLVFQFFGNIAYAVVRAFYKYNSDRHPSSVKDKDAGKIAYAFMNSIADKARKDFKKFEAYTV